MGRPAANSPTTINVNAGTQIPKIDVDNRIPLRTYYRIADNILKQAEIYRYEKNIVDLYIILLRYSSWVSQTIPFHKDYQSLYLEESAYFGKKLLSVQDELEGLKPHVQRQIQRAQGTAQTCELDGQERRQYGSTSSSMEQHVADNGASLDKNDWKVQRGCSTFIPPGKQTISYNQVSSSNFTDKQLQKLSAEGGVAASSQQAGTGIVQLQRGGGGCPIEGGAGGIEEPMVYESVPVVQRKATAAKRFRLFGVNMECPISESDEQCDILSSTAVPHSTMAPQLSQFHFSSSNIPSCQLRPFSGTPVLQTMPSDLLNKGKASMSLDLDV